MGEEPLPWASNGVGRAPTRMMSNRIVTTLLFFISKKKRSTICASPQRLYPVVLEGELRAEPPLRGRLNKNRGSPEWIREWRAGGDTTLHVEKLVLKHSAFGVLNTYSPSRHTQFAG